MDTILTNEIQAMIRNDIQPVLIFQTAKKAEFFYNRYRKRFGDKVKMIFYMNLMPETSGFVYNGKLTKKGEIFASSDYDAYVAVSGVAQEEYLDYGLAPKGKIEVISNGVSMKTYSPLPPTERAVWRTRLGLETDYVIAYSGRANEGKGVDVLLELMQVFEDRNSLNENKFSFLFALSNGPERAEFVNEMAYRFPKLTKSNRIAVVIDIAKYTNGYSNLLDAPRGRIEVLDDTREYLLERVDLNPALFKGICFKPVQGIADITVQPSYSESFSNVVLESMAIGTPVVALDSGGPGELIRNMGGYLITPTGFVQNDVVKRVSHKEVRGLANQFLENIMIAVDDVSVDPGLKQELILAVKRTGRTARDMVNYIDNLIWRL
ncbi:glycosyltransferase [Candidatus Micrarchaeota archaeon]|nr:glycosyltransferase [Candidatus Micrarchaeota archaeon]